MTTDIQYNNSDKYRPLDLITAIIRDKPEEVKKVLDAGVDPNEPSSIQVVNAHSKYPIISVFKSCSKNIDQILNLLFNYGVKISKAPPREVAEIISSSHINFEYIYKDSHITDIPFAEAYAEVGVFYPPGDYFSIFIQEDNIKKAKFLLGNSNITSSIENVIYEKHKFYNSVLIEEGLTQNRTFITESAVKNFHAPMQEDLKIPRKIHHIWLHFLNLKEL
ncbi:MAG: hypothetical protein K0T99_00305 [Alphaproteobacteria bacterium]|nr:hypothetical protein [Alphaproteobacteria bacterium]